MKNAPLRCAILGVGRIGSIHARNIAAHAGAKLVSVSDVNTSAAETTAVELGCAAVPLDDAIRSSDVDAVIICTPTDTHAALTEEAAAAGKAVFCEKPIDIDAARIRDALARVAASGVPLMVGFNRRFDPSFAALQARLAGGEIGSAEIVTILSRDPAPPPLDYIHRSGGLFRDMMIHDLDMARFLLGEEPVEVFARGSSLVDPAIGAADDVDTAVCVLKTASGKLAQISNSRRATYGYDQRIEVHGALGMLSAGNRTATTVVAATASGFSSDPAMPFFLERYAEAYRAEMAAFIAAVQADVPPAPGGEDGLMAQILADAATESARTGAPVAVSVL